MGEAKRRQASGIESVSDPRLTEMSNDVSDLINAWMRRGVDYDEACCVVVGVAADYWRAQHGDADLPNLASIVTAHGGQPAPADISKN